MNRSNLIIDTILFLTIAVLLTIGSAIVETASANIDLETSTRSQSLDDLHILNDTGYLDVFSHYLVLGEVENSGSQAVEQWGVNASFYNAMGGLLCTGAFNTSTSSTALDTINPGRKSPFQISVVNMTLASEVDHYAVAVSSYNTVPAKPLGLQILENSSSTDAFGNMIVSGTIKNVGSVMANSVNIVATFYNESGKVIAVSYCYTEPANIEPNITVPFQIELASVGPYPINKITGYVLEAESSEYAMVPEFPSLLILPLFMVATLLAVIVLRTRRIGIG